MEEMPSQEPGRQPSRSKPPKWSLKSDAEISQADDPEFEVRGVSAGATEKFSGAVSSEKTLDTQGPVVSSVEEAGGLERPAPADQPTWLAEVLPKIQSRPNWSGKTWAWVASGEVGGDRHKWANGVLDNPQATKSLKLRCEYIIMRIEGKA
jgi:hypothetical protein